VDLENKRFSGKNRSADFIIKLESMENATFKGYIENIQSGQIQNFRSFMEMIALIQQKLDENNFPQSTTVMRSWKTDQ
jgi:hypothetical protein